VVALKGNRRQVLVLFGHDIHIKSMKLNIKHFPGENQVLRHEKRRAAALHKSGGRARTRPPERKAERACWKWMAMMWAVA
jgi:hypothetical protein